MVRLCLVSFVLAAGCHSDPVNEFVGNACRDDRDCAETCERGGDFPGGHCTIACRDDRDCTVDSICVDIDGGICLFPCDIDRDCDLLGPEYVCKDRKDTFDRRVGVCLGR